MERRAPMKCLRFLFLTLLLVGEASSADSDSYRRLLLVTCAQAEIVSLSPGEVHKLFLGLPIEKGSVTLEAAINHSDPFLYEIFLQKIANMSSMAYERHLLSNVMQTGGQRPRVFNDARTLINTVKQNPGTVTVLWDSDIKGRSDLAVIGEVWRGPAD
jgi:hypothetical protein